MRISAENLSVSYNKKDRIINVPDKVSFEPVSGEVTVINGRSGSGKTTLINVLAGILLPTEGRVYYDETDIYQISDEKLSAFRCENIGYIPQGASALANLTVMQNILLPSALAGKDNVKFAEELLEMVGLEKLKNAYPDELSGGELRRLAAARALINSPSVIFADEPTNDLDDENASLILELLKAQAEKGAAVIIVTHDIKAQTYADTLYRMDGGKLQSYGISAKEKEDIYDTA